LSLPLPADQGHQAVLRDRVEIAFQIGIGDDDVSGLEQFLYPLQRVLVEWLVSAAEERLDRWCSLLSRSLQLFFR
jgi:hypothetical protein